MNRNIKRSKSMLVFFPAIFIIIVIRSIKTNTDD